MTAMGCPRSRKHLAMTSWPLEWPQVKATRATLFLDYERCEVSDGEGPPVCAGTPERQAEVVP